MLYLIEILHQTTTVELGKRSSRCCILSKFYIKPQPINMLAKSDGVVSYRNSTSNHNIHAVTVPQQRVVSYRNSTSNHNSAAPATAPPVLYLIEILHQTTTTEAVTTSDS